MLPLEEGQSNTLNMYALWDLLLHATIMSCYISSNCELLTRRIIKKKNKRSSCALSCSSKYLEHCDVQLAPLQAGLGRLQAAIQPPQQVHFLPGGVIGGGQHCGSVEQQLGDPS